jgi:hypothetical protein
MQPTTALLKSFIIALPYHSALGQNCDFSELKTFAQPSENNKFLEDKNSLIFFKLSYIIKPPVLIS